VRHAEPLLLVHDQQAEVLEGHIAAEQPVRPDHDVERAALQVGDHALLLRPRHEAREHRDLDGE
jgi:hypothetical protein